MRRNFFFWIVFRVLGFRVFVDFFRSVLFWGVLASVFGFESFRSGLSRVFFVRDFCFYSFLILVFVRLELFIVSIRGIFGYSWFILFLWNEIVRMWMRNLIRRLGLMLVLWDRVCSILVDWKSNILFSLEFVNESEIVVFLLSFLNFIVFLLIFSGVFFV